MITFKFLVIKKKMFVHVNYRIVNFKTVMVFFSFDLFLTNYAVSNYENVLLCMLLLQQERDNKYLFDDYHLMFTNSCFFAAAKIQV
jgi:hypothetical protein